MINLFLVTPGGTGGGAGVGLEEEERCLEGERSRYNGQRQTVKRLRQPPFPHFLSLCPHSASVVRKIGKRRERWEVVEGGGRWWVGGWMDAGGAGAGIKLSKFPTQRPCSGIEKETVLPLDKTSRGEKRGYF